MKTIYTLNVHSLIQPQAKQCSIALHTFAMFTWHECRPQKSHSIHWNKNTVPSHLHYFVTSFQKWPISLKINYQNI